MYQYFVARHGYTNSEITIINKYSKNLNDEDKKIVDGLYKIDVLIYSVKMYFSIMRYAVWLRGPGEGEIGRFFPRQQRGLSLCLLVDSFQGSKEDFHFV